MNSQSPSANDAELDPEKLLAHFPRVMLDELLEITNRRNQADTSATPIPKALENTPEKLNITAVAAPQPRSATTSPTLDYEARSLARYREAFVQKLQAHVRAAQAEGSASGAQQKLPEGFQSPQNKGIAEAKQPNPGVVESIIRPDRELTKTAGEADWAKEAADDRTEREWKKRVFEAAEIADAETEYQTLSDRANSFERAYHDLHEGAQSESNEEAKQQEEVRIRDEEAKLLAAVRQHANDRQLSGLALSGGGIRSATFCLGLIQGLADLGLLKQFDYLSTVSGGGYIGSWLAGWVKRDGSMREVEAQLRSTRIDQARGRPVNGAADVVPLQEEPEQIFHLRAYSNYLSPRLGFMSADTWVLLSIYLRNFFLNQLVLLPAFLALLMLPRFGMLFYDWEPASTAKLAVNIIFAMTAVVCVIVASWTILNAIILLRRSTRLALTTDQVERCHQPGINPLRWLILFPLTLASFLVFWFAWCNLSPGIRRLRAFSREVEAVSSHPIWRFFGRGFRTVGDFAADSLQAYPYISTVVFMGLGTGFLFLILHSLFALRVRHQEAASAEMYKGSTTHLGWWVVAGWLSGTAAGAVLGLVLQFIYAQTEHGKDPSLYIQALESSLVLTVGPPIGLLVFVLGTVIQVGLMGKSLAEGEREWWASLCGGIMRCAFCWIVFCGVALFSVPFLIWAGATVQTVLGLGWVGTTIGGLMAARSPNTGTASSKSKLPLELVARVAPYVFLVGLLVVLSCAISWFVDETPGQRFAAAGVADLQNPSIPSKSVSTVSSRVDEGGKKVVHSETEEYTLHPNAAGVRMRSYWIGLLNSAPDSDQPPSRDLLSLLVKHLIWAGLLAAIAVISGRCVGVNTFSLQGLYDNRLTRCYLGASRPRKAAQTGRLRGTPSNMNVLTKRGGQKADYRNPVTGFDPADDLALSSLRMAPAGVGEDNKAYRGPYLLINTALNLSEADELAWQERKAEAFLLSPLHCGSKSTGFRSTKTYAGGLSLGHAMAVSGAAFTSNMGYHSSPAVTALLTVFNVRLGAWLGNPNGKHWDKDEPGAIWMLFKELLGRTDRRSNFVYLSDGGHFENLGIYELVRRQCRFIVACDGDADPEFQFFDLGSMIRKCRTDLGVPIEIDVTPIKRQDNGFSRWHCAIGRIGYDALDPRAVPGILVYIKTSLTGDEPSDVLNYAVEHPTFPHETTLNQWFTESQFESYRALGKHVADQVFKEAMPDVEEPADLNEAAHRRVVRRLFSNLHRRWFPPIPRLEPSFLQSVDDVIHMHGRLASNPELKQFNADLYKELVNAGPVPTISGAATSVANTGTGSMDDRSRNELHAVGQMLRIMEKAWFEVQLEGYYSHPMNRGWMNVFRRWVSSLTFRKYWLTLRGEFNQDFVRFCESELKLGRGFPWVYPMKQQPSYQRALAELEREFNGEWPEEPSLEERFAKRHKKSTPHTWIFALASDLDCWPTTWSVEKCPCGFAALWQVNPESYELLVWLRGPYRTLRIGRECMDNLFPDILARLQKEHKHDEPNPLSLQSCYPGRAEANNSDRIRRELWQNFYFQYGFRPADQPDPNDDQLRLTRNVPLNSGPG